MNKPEQLESPNIEAIKEICKDYIDYLDSDEYHEDNDYTDYVFETVITALYGENVWEWINNKIS